jgi:hypothetical protein
MDMKKMKIADAVGKMIDILTPFDSEDRRRVISAVLTLLGETTPAAERKADTVGAGATGAGGADSLEFLHPKVRTWAKQNGLTPAELHQVFHFTGENVPAEIIGVVPGKSGNQKAPNAYVLVGAASFVGTGEQTFTDKDARALCQAQGCYDHTNHTKRLNNGKSNFLTGSKDKGWSLTHPGLKQAALLIKEMIQPDAD